MLFTVNSSGCSTWDLNFDTQFGNIYVSSVTTQLHRNLCNVNTHNANQTCFQSPLGCEEKKMQPFYGGQIPTHTLPVQEMDQMFLAFCSVLFSLVLHLCFVTAKLFPFNEPSLKRQIIISLWDGVFVYRVGIYLYGLWISTWVCWFLKSCLFIP